MNISPIYTIGYSVLTLTEFREILEEYKISVVVDVRSMPYSKFRPEYNKDSLREWLDIHNILYRHYQREFGARQEAPALLTNGQVDFHKMRYSLPFQEGITKICKGLEQGYTFLLLCSEADPMECHRGILIGRTFHELKYPVVHLVPRGEKKTQTQEELEERLLGRYFPDCLEESLFAEVTDKQKCLLEAYRKQAKKIAYIAEK